MPSATTGFVRQYIWTGVAGAPYYMTFYGMTGEFEDNFSDTCDDFITSIMVHAITGTVVRNSEGTFNWDAVAQEKTGTIPTDPFEATGSATGTALPTQVQGLASWVTNEYIGGRQVRGRTYLPAFTEGALSGDGSMSAATRGFVQTSVTDLWTSTGLAVNSPKHKLLYAVTGGSVSTEWATQRSRGQRG